MDRGGEGGVKGHKEEQEGEVVMVYVSPSVRVVHLQG